MNMFNHVQIKVKDLTISRMFYDSIMNALGYEVVLTIDDILVGYGTSVNDMFEIRQYNEKYLLSSFCHLAFNASTKESVDSFYNNALLVGATCNGKPGYRLEYGDGYYAAFVIDPDGHNIEAVYVENKNKS